MSIIRALSRARLPILTIALAHVLALVIGIIMAHTGNQCVLSFRDNLVANAHASDPASVALQQGNALSRAD